MPTPAQVASGRASAPTGDYLTDLANGWIQTRTPGPGNQPSPAFPTASNVTVPPGALAPWQTALAAALAGTGLAIVWDNGASTAQGGSAPSNVISKSTFGQYRTAKIAQGYPIGGDFFLSVYTSDWSTNNAPNGWPFNTAPGGTHPSAWANAGPWWIPQYNATGVTLATPQMQATPPVELGYTAGSARVFYFDLGSQDGGGSGTGFTWKHNTAASEAGATTHTLIGDNQIHSFDVNNLAGGTIYFGNQSNLAAMVIIGILWCPGNTISTSGVVYCRMGAPGFTMGDFIITTNRYPADKLSRYIGPNGATAPFAPAAALSPIFQPDLAIFEPLDDVAYIPPGTLTQAGNNPAVNVHGVPADVYKWGLERQCNAVQRKPTGCTVVHELPSFPDGYTSDTSVAATYVTQNFGDFFDAHIAIALREGHIISDTRSNWKQLGFTYGYFNTGNTHPNDAGAGTAAPTGNPPAYLNVQARASRWLGIGL